MSFSQSSQDLYPKKFTNIASIAMHSNLDVAKHSYFDNIDVSLVLEYFV